MEPVAPPPEFVQSPDNDVLTLTVYKMEPECLSYIFKMRAKYEPHDPEFLEQILVMQDVLKNLRKQTEATLLQKYITIGREVRKSMHDARIEKEAHADDRPEGGESEPS